ncbi:MAG: ATP-dependent RNA helicase [Thelocarpon superellum]|nr:MAG: ATP-dependent RNA helicase [Thelocarpon superellum]
MSTISPKRKMGSRNDQRVKRRKVDQRHEDLVTTTGPTQTTLVKVSSQQLPWKEVSVDRLEDAEGFCGLEEVDDVEVVRELEKGTVTYRISDTRHDKERRNEGEASEGEGGEWKGLGDATIAPARGPGRPTERRKKKAAHKGPPGGTNGFAHLDEQATDDGVDVSAWDVLRLSSETMTSLSRLGFARPTPIQSASIPEVLAGHDVIGKASTGSGKTLAFAIPILEYFQEREEHRGGEKGLGAASRPDPCALIISPTRELAHQLSSHLTALCAHTPSASPSIVTVTGGLSVQKQQRLLAKADIVIGTPGRLWDVLGDGNALVEWMRRVKFVVVDEADRLVDEGHYREFEQILDVLEVDDQAHKGRQPRQSRQTLVFSATFHQDLQRKLSGKGKRGVTDGALSTEYLMKKIKFRQPPKMVDVNPQSQMAEGLKEGLVECGGMEKDLFLYTLIMYHTQQRILIFTNSISTVRRLTALFQHLDLPVQALHSQMAQKARMRSMERFSSASASSAVHPILIATDVAARGLDIPHVDLIIHYHVPRAADTYVHRSGRTARAGQIGRSILMCAPGEVQGVRRLIHKIHAPSSADSAPAPASAPSPSRSESKSKNTIPALTLDSTLLSKLKPRMSLAQRLTESQQAAARHAHEDNWLKSAAADLGVDYDSEEFTKASSKSRKGGRGDQRGQENDGGKEEGGGGGKTMSKGETAALKAELKRLLAQRLNLGVSTRYFTSALSLPSAAAGAQSGVDVDALLAEREARLKGDEEGKGNGKGEGADLFLGSLLDARVLLR